MSAKETYKQKMEAKVAVVQAQLVKLKAQADNLVADALVEHTRQVDKLEEGIIAMKAKLTELGEAGDDAWKNLKDGVDSTWSALSTAVGNIAKPSSKAKAKLT